MNGKRTVIGWVAAILFPGLLLGAGTKIAPPPLQREASSTAESWKGKEGQRITRTINRRFTFAAVYPELYKEEDLLLAETFDRRIDHSAEGEKSSVTVEALHAGKEGPALWKFTTEGSSGEPEEQLYRVVRTGCCGARDASIYFSLVNGRELFTADAPVLKIEVPNTAVKRFAAYLDSVSVSEIPEAAGEKNIVGVLQYGSDRESGSRVLVLAPQVAPAEYDYAVKSVSFVVDGKETDADHFDVWAADKSSDPAKIGGFSIRVRVFTEPDLLAEIPVTADRLDIANARCGTGIRFRAAPGNPARKEKNK